MNRRRKYGNRPREDKSTLKVPKCPFCGDPFRRPGTLQGDFTDFLGGRCSCGAVYVCDVTGKNLGETLMDALVYACGNDWDRALALTSGRDYDDHIIAYDYMSHQVPTRFGQTVRGRMVFVRLRL